jgi:hypothetical protein
MVPGRTVLKGSNMGNTNEVELGPFINALSNFCYHQPRLLGRRPTSFHG